MQSTSQFDLPEMLAALRLIHFRMREKVVAACESQSTTQLSSGAEVGAGDFIYAIDRVSEHELVELIDREIAAFVPIVLIGEGIADGKIVLPRGTSEDNSRFRIIFDPIDGTRGLMYQKRSAWILTGVAPNRGSQTSLADIELAIQTEIPLVKQHLCDEAWAIKGQGVGARRFNRLTGDYSALTLRPSMATDFSHGYATVCRFFPGARDVLARLDDDLCRELLGGQTLGGAVVFEDQYACTGGQVYGLASGQDRFVTDLRPLVQSILVKRGLPGSHCCHPYDLCTKLIAEEAGVAVTGPNGEPIVAPLDVHSNVAWVGYSNAKLRSRVEPILQNLIASIAQQ